VAGDLRQSGVRPSDADMVILGEELSELARRCMEHPLTYRIALTDAITAWDNAMTDRFHSAIEDGDR
jgi:hypothetical protein